MVLFSPQDPNVRNRMMWIRQGIDLAELMVEVTNTATAAALASPLTTAALQTIITEDPVYPGLYRIVGS